MTSALEAISVPPNSPSNVFPKIVGSGPLWQPREVRFMEETRSVVGARELCLAAWCHLRIWQAFSLID